MMNIIGVEEFLKTKFDYILDARSPKEYEESHIPGSVNFYVLNNDEHHEIGHIYKNVSKTEAKHRAIIYILKNISEQLKNFKPKPGSKILVYCARGGHRSTALYTILSQLDYVVFKLTGGYKSYRQWVVSYLKTFPHKKFIVLRGNSGCGKSELIQMLKPSIDLEKLANHYGSNFGDKGFQPSQKQFENDIADTLLKIDPEEYIFIEGESKKIGKLYVPYLLHERMKNGIQVEITSPLEKRVKRILDYYGNINEKEFLNNLDKIKKFVSNEIYSEIKNYYNSGNLEKVAELLLVKYYDKVYRKMESDYTVENTDTEKSVNKLKNIKLSLS